MLDWTWLQYGKETLNTGSDYSSAETPVPWGIRGGTNGNVTLETQRFDSIEIRLSTISHLLCKSQKIFSQYIIRNPSPRATRLDEDLSPLSNKWVKKKINKIKKVNKSKSLFF